MLLNSTIYCMQCTSIPHSMVPVYLTHTHTQNSHYFHSQKIKYAIYPSLDVYKVKTLWQLKESGYTEHILEIAAGGVTPSHDG